MAGSAAASCTRSAHAPPPPTHTCAGAQPMHRASLHMRPPLPLAALACVRALGAQCAQCAPHNARAQAICSFLPLADCRNARLVCSSWRRLAGEAVEAVGLTSAQLKAQVSEE